MIQRLWLGGLIAVACLSTLTVPQVQAVGEPCSASQQCPQSSPCCSAGGTCGSGALQCLGGCQPMASFSAASCVANPICQDKNVTLTPASYNDPHTFYPIALYNGDASSAPFTLDYGFLGKGPQGVLLELTAASQTRISTTDYMLYGSVQVTARHVPRSGLVFAFITMSDTKDEIDWEFTTDDPNDLQTNYFGQGVIAKGTAASVNKSSINVNDWHTYGLNWQPDKLQWLVDGKVLRTVTQASAGVNYPRSPSRVQISVWAGGNTTNPPGVIAWSGGEIDWTDPEYTSPGYYTAEVSAFSQTCASNSASNLTTQGSGKDVTSWLYNGQTSAALGEPAYVLSMDPITFLKDPGQDAGPGPGFKIQSAFTQQNNNAWDGSGDTSGLAIKQTSSSTSAAASGATAASSSSSTGNNSASSAAATPSEDSASSGGWLANNRTLSIAVPVAGAALAVAFIWAFGVWMWRRMRRSSAENDAMKSMNAVGVMSLKRDEDDDDEEKYTTSQGRTNSQRRAGGRTSAYRALRGGSNDFDDQDSSEDESSIVPLGAQRIGKGYGPAVGPRAGRVNTTVDSPVRYANVLRSSAAAATPPPPPTGRAVPTTTSYANVAHQQRQSPVRNSAPVVSPSNGRYATSGSVYAPIAPPPMRGVFASPYPGAGRPTSNATLYAQRPLQTSPQRNPYAAQQRPYSSSIYPITSQQQPPPSRYP